MFTNADNLKTVTMKNSNATSVNKIIDALQTKIENAEVVDEAFVKANKITLRGLNEKLGTNKHFYVAGHTEDKTFIAESFKITKD